MSTERRAIASLHFIVFLWGFTAILGDLISLSAYWLVWWRTGLTCLSIMMLPGVIRMARRVTPRLLLVFVAVGVIIALHWITFFGAIKYANASVALVAFSTTALMTAFLEPLITRSKIDLIDILCSVIVVPGMLLVIGDLEAEGLLGFWIGVFSAFLSALFAVINKIYVTQMDTKAITLLELGSAWLSLTIGIPLMIYFLPDNSWWPQGWDWGYLVVLAVACTTLPFIWHLEVLKHVSAFTSNLVINLEPVYGILLAAVLLDDREELSDRFYLGVFVIMLVVLLYPFIKKRFSKKTAL